VDERSPGIRFRRALTAAVAAMAATLLLLFVPIIIYAFALAFRARGAPDQAAINSFAATISPVLMPWFVRVLTLLFAFRVVRKNAAARAADGLLVGAVAGAMSLAVTMAFGGRLDVRNLLLFLVVVGLGWLGGFVGRRMAPKA
jgi:cbb3-type cytochrome oxidase subunit 3